MDRLINVLKESLEGYAGRALNGYSYLTNSADNCNYTLISVGYLPDKRIVDASLIVRIVGEQIVIERDVNDRPLIDVLLQAGIKRDEVVLAYNGELVEESVA